MVRIQQARYEGQLSNIYRQEMGETIRQRLPEYVQMVEYIVGVMQEKQGTIDEIQGLRADSNSVHGNITTKQRRNFAITRDVSVGVGLKAG